MPDFIARRSGERLDTALAREAGISRAAAARMVSSGAVTVDGRAPAKSLRLETGARVSYELPDAEPARLQPEAIDLHVVYEDEWLLVVSKPAGLVVHPSPGHPAGTLVNALLARAAGLPAGGDADRPGIVHRLDAGTSGLMIVAKDAEAHERLTRAMSARAVTRVYLALVEGRPQTDLLTIDAPMGRSPKHRKKMSVVAGGREAVTLVEVKERHARTSFLEVRPKTGRTHQIRVHLLAAGHPIVGDPVYGRSRALAREIDLGRPFLHATRLALEHPITGKPLEVFDPLPQDLAEALARARELSP